MATLRSCSGEACLAVRSCRRILCGIPATQASPLLLLLMLLPSCARYEYNLTQPPDLASHIGSQTDHVLSRNPLEYRFRSVDNRLVMRIFNRVDQPIQLLGDRSTVVSP